MIIFFFLNLSLNSKIFKGHVEGKLKTRCRISPRDRALICAKLNVAIVFAIPGMNG